MLTRIRRNVAPILNRIAALMVKLGIDPNIITLMGLIISFSCPLAAIYGPIWLLIAIIASAFMDVLDGVVARLSGKVTKFGAFLDSFSDRIEELMYVISFVILGLNYLEALIFIATSYLISYLRALGELRGLRMEGVGFFERGERILLIIITLFLYIIMRNSYVIDYGILIGIIFNVVTIIQRFMYVAKNLRS